MPNPETWAGLQEERLPPSRDVEALELRAAPDPAALRARGHAEEIASLFGLGSAQSADRRIREVVEKLRKEMP